MDLIDRVLRAPWLSNVLGLISLVALVAGALASRTATAVVGGVAFLAVLQVLLYRTSVLAKLGRNYETLVYDWEWDIDASDGSHAVCNRTLGVRYLSDTRAIAEMVASNATDPFAGFQCSPGTLVHQYEDTGQKWGLISLGDVRKRGQTETFNIRRELTDVFTDPTVEWVFVEWQSLTHNVNIKVVLPPGRAVKRAWLEQASSGKRTELTDARGIEEAAGRKHLVYRGKPNLRRPDRLTIRWEWA